MKLGRRRPRAIGPHFRLRNYLRATLPTPPASCDYSGPALDILADVMGNDQLGDCTCAAIYHYLGLLTANAGAPFHATLAQVVALYSAVSGYNPADPSTDQGADELTVLNYVCSNNLADGSKGLGWVLVDAGNKTEVMTAIDLFEGCLLTLELPDTYVNPFPSGNGFTWDVGTPDPQNGHAIMVTGYDATGVKIDTWGMLGTLTWAALAALCTSAGGGGCYALLTPDQIAKGAAKAPNGFDWASLIADFDAMGGSVPAPTPAPVPPAPGPTPTAPPSLAQAQAAIRAALQGDFALVPRSTAIAQASAALAPLWP